MGIDILKINALAELERFGFQYEFAGGDEVKVCCPFHDDSTPSCLVNTEKRVFKCHTAGCEASGDIVDLLARQGKTARAIVLIDISQRYGVEEEKIIEPATVERFHQNIWKAGALLRELYARGVSDEMIRYYRFGEDGGRVIIPVRGKSGAFINLRKYLPGAPGKDKMRNSRGQGSVRWFPIEQLAYHHIVLTGGECKAIVAAAHLNQYDIGAITATCGEKNLPMELLADLKGKVVYVIMDVDKAGKAAAKKHCEQLSVLSSFVANIELPLDPDKYPKGDINDFIATEHGNLKELLDNVKAYVPEKTDKLLVDDSPPIDLELSEAILADNANRRMRVKGVVSAMDTTPYLVPKDIVIECLKNQQECGICPVFLLEQAQFQIPAESPAILEFVGCNNLTQLDVVKSTVGIPRSCRGCEFVRLSEYNVEDTRISPQLEITSKSGDRQPIPAICIGSGLQLNEGYEFTGKLFAHPKTQQATLLISSHKTSQDALSTYTTDNAEALSVFWPTEWTVPAIQEKLDSIYQDFEANITRIYQRQDMHLIVDLTYHSPLFIDFDGKVVKGWVDSLIMGDSSHGKSDVSFGMMQHYGLGHRMECGNASVAGILGGMEKMGDRWFVSWGVVPCNDRRIILMDEIKDAPIEILGRLTDMRSSGVAQITKIGKHWKTHARTRQLWLSNPRSDMKMSQHTFGVKAISDLIGSPEDVRRFDVVLLVADSEIDAREINKRHSDRPSVEHCYSGDLCRQLVLWAWTRGESQVVYTPEATTRTLTEASEMCSIFSDVIPLVDRGSMRYKIARLAAALAARLFSCNEDYTKLVVHEAHVEYIAAFLKRIYSSKVFGYVEFSAAQKLLNTLIDPELIKKQIELTPHPRDFCKSLLTRDFIEAQDLADWTSWDRVEVQNMLSLFVRKHALIRVNRAYCKSSLFIEFIKGMIDSEDLKDRPAHIPEERF